MRPGQNRRVRGRTRNKGPNPLTRSFESNGPDVKIRGTAQHVADKYAQLARDAQAGSDPVSAENYLQHAEHYYRLIAAAQEQFKQQYGALRSDEEGEDGDEDMQGPNGFGHPGERMNQDEFGDGGYGQPAYEGRPNGGERPVPPRYDRNDRGEYRNDRPNNDRQGGDRQDRGDQNRNDNYRGDNRGDRNQRFDRGEQRFDRNAPQDRHAPNGAGPERPPQAYDRNEGQRPDQPRNGADARPDGGRPDNARPDGNRRDRFNRDGNRDPNRGDAPRQEGGRRDFNRPDRGPRQDQPRQDQPRQDQPRHEQPRQDAPRYAQSDEAEEAGLPAFLMNPVRPPVSAPVVDTPDEAPPRAPVVAQSAPVQSAPDDVPDSPAEGEAVTGIRPRRRRTRKVADASAEAPVMAADDTPVD